MTAGERPFADTTRRQRAWLTPFGLGAFALGTAISVPLVGPVGLLALLVPVGMVGYSALLAYATTEESQRGSGEVAQKHVELRDANTQLCEQVAELHAAAVDGVRQRVHEHQRSYQSIVRGFIEAMHPNGEAARRPDGGA